MKTESKELPIQTTTVSTVDDANNPSADLSDSTGLSRPPASAGRVRSSLLAGIVRRMNEANEARRLSEQARNAFELGRDD